MAASNLYNYIDKIQIDGQTYAIGMQNAVHYHGAVTLPEEQFTEFYSDEACQNPLLRTEYAGASFIYSKGASLNQPEIQELLVGCMVSIGQAEFVLTKVAGSGESQINTWAKMGEIKSDLGTIHTAVEFSTGEYVTGLGDTSKVKVISGISTKDAKVLNEITPVTKSVTVVTDTITGHDFAPLSQTFVTNVTDKTQTFVTKVSMTDGSLSTAAQFDAITTVAGGKLLADEQAERISVVTKINYTDVDTTGGKVLESFSGGEVSSKGGNIVMPQIADSDKAKALTGAVVTGVADKVITSIEGSYATSVSTGLMVEYVDHALKFNFTNVATGVTESDLAALAPKEYELKKNVGLELSSDYFAQKLSDSSTVHTVVTEVTQSAFVPVEATVITEVTGGKMAAAGTALVVPEIKSADIKLNSDTALKEVTYVAPALSPEYAENLAYVEKVDKGDLQVVTASEKISVITSVPVGAQTVVTEVTSAGSKVIASVTPLGEDEALSDFEFVYAQAIATAEASPGSVVTAVY